MLLLGQCKLWPPPPIWDIYWPTVVLMVAAVIGIFVAWSTLNDIKVQTQNAKASADAALLSAQAVVSSERAWLIVEDLTVQPLVELTNERTKIQFTLRFKNEGRTPCWITEKRICFQMVERLPDEPFFDGTSLAFNNPEEEPVGVARHSLLAGELVCNGVHLMVLETPGDEHAFKGNIPVLYGLIKYRDPFSGDRKTFFGFQFKSRGRELIHSPAYNKNV